MVRTICQECSVGCGLLVSLAGPRVVDVEGDEDHPVSRGRLCARGSAFVQGLASPARLTGPAARRAAGAALAPLDGWKAAVDAHAERLRAAREAHGPDALVVACDREGGLDFEVGARRFARLWGTSQVFGPATPPEASRGAGPGAPCTAWVQAGTLLLVEADLAATHPVLFAWVQEARRRGARVVAADARLGATLSHADVAVRIEPGRGNLLALALARLLLVDTPSGDPTPADSGAARWRASLAAMSLDGAEAVLGLSLERLRGLAALLAARGPVTVITGGALGALPHHGAWAALAGAMRWTGRPGGGWYPVDLPPALEVEAELPDLAPPAPAPRRTLAEVVAGGGVRAVICSGDALGEHLPFGGVPAQAEVVAHFGSFPGASWARATLTFPAALRAERDGLFFAADRTVEWADAVLEAPEGCRSGLDFWIELARRFGWEKHFPWTAEDGRGDPAALAAWLLARCPAANGARLEDLRGGGPGGRRRGLAGAAPEPEPAPASLAAAGATPDAAYPLALAAAPSGCRSSEASRFWEATRDLVRDDVLEIHPDTARRLGIEPGAEVIVETRHGVAPARAAVTRAVSARTVAWPRPADGLGALVRRPDESADAARARLSGAPLPP